MFLLEFFAFLGQFFAWMLDAHSAVKLYKANGYTGSRPYYLAVAAAVAGLFVSLATGYLTVALFAQSEALVEIVEDGSSSEASSAPAETSA